MSKERTVVGEQRLPARSATRDGTRRVLLADLDHILAHTAALWDELRGQRLFITGGTGFFGCWLLESFTYAVDALGLRATAVVLTRDAAAFRRKAPHLASHPALAFHAGDVRSFRWPEGKFSHIIHAATPATAPETPQLFLDIIERGTQHTLDFARHCGAKKLLLTSSGAVYGTQPATITHVPEDFPGVPDPADPRAAYGNGKRQAEIICNTYAHDFGIEAKIARCFAFVGPYLPLHVHLAIGSFIRDGLRGGPIHVRSDGTPVRSYLYAADLAVWLWTILFSGVSCRPYNVGSEEETTIGALATTVARLCGPGISVDITGQPEPHRPPERYVPSTCRAAGELGLGSTIGLEEAIRRTIAWHARCADTAAH